MKLTAYTNYALRTLQFAALRTPDRNTCPLIGICKLSRAIQNATSALIAVLDDLTLADIASNHDDLIARIAPCEAGSTAFVERLS